MPVSDLVLTAVLWAIWLPVEFPLLKSPRFASSRRWNFCSFQLFSPFLGLNWVSFASHSVVLARVYFATFWLTLLLCWSNPPSLGLFVLSGSAGFFPSLLLGVCASYLGEDSWAFCPCAEFWPALSHCRSVLHLSTCTARMGFVAFVAGAGGVLRSHANKRGSVLIRGPLLCAFPWPDKAI